MAGVKPSIRKSTIVTKDINAALEAVRVILADYGDAGSAAAEGEA